MKKSFVMIGGVIVVLVGVVIAVFSMNHSSNNNQSGTKNSSMGYTTVDACNVMTSSVATQILGSTAVKGNDPAGGESTDDIAFSECMYSAGPNADPSHVASVAVRSAKDSAGMDSNKAMFSATGKPSGAQTVNGYGDSAFWDTSLNQLDILKGNNWYIIINYTGVSPLNGTATLAQAEQLAQALKLQ